MTLTRDATQAQRVEELLVQRAIEGLSPEQAAELQGLGAEDDQSFDLAVAALDIATTRPEPLPAQLLERILASADASAPSTDAPIQAPRRRRSERIAWTTAAFGLAAAAAAVLWATNRPPEIQIRDRVVAPVARSVQDERLDLLKAPDTQAIPWTPTKDPAGQSALGDVVWSQSRQEGFVKFEGLASNDPKRAQYQLWIFDKNRDDKFPVDGGVFDVGADGEAIVRIAPNTTPLSETPVAAGAPTRAVLELAAGESARLGINPGDRVRSSIFGDKLP